ITSQVQPILAFGEALIQDWRNAGLLKPSVLKPVLFTAEKSLLRKALGRFSVNDRAALRKVIKTILG
ncbi:MAG: hypothetical protein L0Y32_03255, partial [Nevskiales bacterium]|nr:hypothetical protein [Nevskiales bacterium]